MTDTRQQGGPVTEEQAAEAEADAARTIARAGFHPRLRCPLCGGFMYRTATVNTLVVICGLLVAVVGLVVLLLIHWPTGLALLAIGLLPDLMRRKVWKCIDCDSVVPRG